jgi:putative colanic acid biosynthesis acetyltransferase WcaF
MSPSNDSHFYPQSYRSELSLRNKIGRALWGVAWTLLFRPSPRPCFGWRRWLVKVFGGKIAPDAILYPSTRIYAPWNLEMGPRSCLGDFVD